MCACVTIKKHEEVIKYVCIYGRFLQMKSERLTNQIKFNYSIFQQLTFWPTRVMFRLKLFGIGSKKGTKYLYEL